MSADVPPKKQVSTNQTILFLLKWFLIIEAVHVTLAVALGSLIWLLTRSHWLEWTIGGYIAISALVGFIGWLGESLVQLNEYKQRIQKFFSRNR